GLAGGGGLLGAVAPDDGLRAAMAATHVPTTTANFVVAEVAVKAVFGPKVTVTRPAWGLCTSMLVAAKAAIAPWAAGRRPRAARDPEGDGELDPLPAGAGGVAAAAAPDPVVLLHATSVPATARTAVAPAKSRMAPM